MNEKDFKYELIDNILIYFKYQILDELFIYIKGY